jgi:hypothetical protein
MMIGCQGTGSGLLVGLFTTGMGVDEDEGGGAVHGEPSSEQGSSATPVSTSGLEASSDPPLPGYDDSRVY